MFNSKKDMYSNSMFFFSEFFWGFVPTYPVPQGYMHKNDGDLEWKAHLRGFSIMCRVLHSDFDSRRSFCQLLLTHKEVLDDV